MVRDGDITPQRRRETHMADKPKVKEEPSLGKKGMKLYLTPDEERRAREEAQRLRYRSVQDYLRDKLRQESLKKK